MAKSKPTEICAIVRRTKACGLSHLFMSLHLSAPAASLIARAACGNISLHTDGSGGKIVANRPRSSLKKQAEPGVAHSLSQSFGIVRAFCCRAKMFRYARLRVIVSETEHAQLLL